MRDATPDEIETLLEMDEPRLAEARLDARVRAEKKASLATLRRRAEVIEASAIDDDLDALMRDAKRIGEAAAHGEAEDEDRARWAWALLMANATARARKASRDAQTSAGLAYVDDPTNAHREALFAASSAHPERAIRLLLQRAHPVVDEARALYETRTEHAADRHARRALRLLVAAMNAAGDPEATRFRALDPILSSAERRARLARLEAIVGADALAQPWLALAQAARGEGDLDTHAMATLRTDDLLAKRRGQAVLVDRSAMLVPLRRALLAAKRFDEARSVIEREEALNAKRGLLVPDEWARAELAEARGDWDACLAHHRAGIARVRTSTHPAYGPNSPTLRLAEGWLAQAEARARR